MTVPGKCQPMDDLSPCMRLAVDEARQSLSFKNDSGDVIDGADELFLKSWASPRQRRLSFIGTMSAWFCIRQTFVPPRKSAAYSIWTPASSAGI
jgi:hypothetical protein